MLSAKENSVWAASWLVGSAIVVSATCLSALDAQVLGYPGAEDSYRNSYPQSPVYGGGGNSYPQSSGYDGWEYGSGPEEHGYNGLNGPSGINIGNGWGGSESSSVISHNDGAGNRVQEGAGGEGDSESYSKDTEDTPTDPSVPSVGPKRSVNPPASPAPPSYPDEWKVPLNAPFNSPPMNPTYPDTWKYPPLVEKVSVGLSSVGVDEPVVPHRAAPEPLPSPRVAPPSVSVEPQPAQETVLERVGGVIGDTVGGVISVIGTFFKGLWSF